jgi:nucleotide-binding universal stress UspA family protein
MSDVILAVLGCRETAPQVLEAARQLVTLIGHAKLIALAVEMPPLTEPLGAEALMAEVSEVAALHGRDRQRTAALRVLFDEWAVGARRAGIETEWRKITGPAGKIAEQMGRRADFIVIAQPTEDDDAHTRGGFNGTLLRSERPVLVVPPGGVGTFGRNVAIAWRDDGRVIKAVIAALRLLSDATEVHVLQGSRAGRKCPPIPTVFQDHGIETQAHVLLIHGVFGQVLLSEAHVLGADMLVMGAYAHSPLREVIFGGVTRYMLDHADLPVLMRH